MGYTRLRSDGRMDTCQGRPTGEGGTRRRERMSDLQRRTGMFRRGRNDIENHIIDEYAAGRLDRREFIRRGTVAGLSLPMLSLLIAACGGENDTNSASSAAAGSRHGGRHPPRD